MGCLAQHFDSVYLCSVYFVYLAIHFYTRHHPCWAPWDPLFCLLRSRRYWLLAFSVLCDLLHRPPIRWQTTDRLTPRLSGFNIAASSSVDRWKAVSSGAVVVGPHSSESEALINTECANIHRTGFRVVAKNTLDNIHFFPGWWVFPGSLSRYCRETLFFSSVWTMHNSENKAHLQRRLVFRLSKWISLMIW